MRWKVCYMRRGDLIDCGWAVSVLGGDRTKPYPIFIPRLTTGVALEAVDPYLYLLNNCTHPSHLDFGTPWTQKKRTRSR